MSVKLRFRRMGRRKLPVYGLVATDSRSPRDGRFIEDLGRYEPVAEPAVVKLDAERVVYWLGQGAQPSHTVRNLLQKEGVLLRWALTRRGEEPEAIEQQVAEFRERRDGAQPTTKTRAERRAEALEAERTQAKERAAEIAKERAEREAELQREREEAEAAERAAAEEARAAATADAADSEALTTAADQPAAEGGASETPDAVVEGEPVPQTSSQADGDNDTADRLADAEAEGGDAAAAAATAAEVAPEAPDAAEEQPAVAETESEDVAADTGADVADQASAGAAEGAPAKQAEGLATAPEGTSGAEPSGDAPPEEDAKSA
ncbi:30S ribosomal protein S16 [Rubrivirga sp. S365]|uniref:Small ribosomal subunit protein bS16 n=1 Tax=Rubrivirga litoralis TaxID=3075598 RepID=A0ABU3BMW4_9BACT|nr:MULTISPECIES: 30S ribosomal protein S16 [unclassified Rubrivirga]MDT0630616.1 30S ribosomal protein S16 [Rubrivirga sp. F394]MDT7857671.1 30S ribosomal protein S16 [Rubrivirga sp. S365]